MTIATEMDAPLIALALVIARLEKRPGNEDLVEQITAAQQHPEELRGAVQALEEIAARPRPSAPVISMAAVRHMRNAGPEAAL